MKKATSIFYLKPSIQSIIENITQNKVTLEDLKYLQTLEKDDKQSFFEDLQDMVSYEQLHELNKKVMEHAIDLSDPKDPAFLLRRSEDAIFRDLFYLEAKKIFSDFTVKLENNKSLTVDFPKELLELYNPLIKYFYEKKYQDTEFQKELYNTKCSASTISFENLSEWFMKTLKQNYINKSIAESITTLFISRVIKEHYKAKYEDKDILSKVLSFDKELNNKEGKFINSLASKKILELINSTDHKIETITITNPINYNSSIEDQEVVIIKSLGDNEMGYVL